MAKEGEEPISALEKYQAQLFCDGVGLLLIYNAEEEVTNSRHAKEQVNSISARKNKSKLSLSKLKRKNNQSHSQLAE